MNDVDNQKIGAYGQKKKWSIESDPEMILILELPDRSWKLSVTNLLKYSVKNMQEHMGNFSRNQDCWKKFKWNEKYTQKIF